MTVRKILALVIGLSMLLGLAACNFKKVEVPSDKEVKNAVEEEYDMKFKLDSSDIAKDGSEAEWVFIAKDGSLQVTVTWNSKKPEKFKMEDETLVSLPSDRDVQKAVEDKYGMSFYLESSNITDDESEATWVYMSDDYTLEVIVTWSAKKPDKFEYNEKDFIYQCTRDQLNGTNPYAKNKFNDMLAAFDEWVRIREEKNTAILEEEYRNDESDL